MWTLVFAAQVDFYHIRFRTSVENSEKAIHLARQFEDPRAEVDARLSAMRGMYSLGDKS